MPQNDILPEIVKSWIFAIVTNIIYSMKSLILYNRLKKNKLFKDSFWALTGTVVGKSLSLLAGILVVRFLGKEIYGEYGMIKSTLLNISIFTTLGLGYTGTRFISKFLIDNKYLVRDIIRKIYIVTSLFSGFIMILLFIFSEQVALYIEAPDTASAFRFTAFIVLINAVNTSQIGILAGLKAFKHTAINNSITGVITFICSVVLTFYMGLEGSLLALLLSLGIGCILNMCSINKLIKDIPYEKTDKTFNKELLFFSMPIAIQELLFSAVSWSSSFSGKIFNIWRIRDIRCCWTMDCDYIVYSGCFKKCCSFLFFIG